MKRKFILLAMMLLTLIGGVKFNVLNAQEDVVVINEVPDTYGASYPFVINNYYQLSQHIVPSTKINHDGGVIDKIAFKVKSGLTKNFTLYLQNTDLNSLSSWVAYTDADKVYSNESLDLSNVDTDYWLILDIDNFDYEGGNLLIIASDNTNKYGNETGTGTGLIYNTGGDYCTLYNNGTSPITTSSSAYQSARQLTVKLFFAEPADDIVPAAPTNLVATTVDYKSVNLTWDVAENALKYQVYQGENMIAETDQTEYLVEGLSDGTEYCFTVKSVRYNNTSEEASNVACATTDVLPVPETPANLTATNITHNFVTLTWDAVEYAESYTVSYTGGTITVTENTCDVTGLTPETNYTFSVTANNTKGSSSAAEVSAKTLEYNDPFAGKLFRIKVMNGSYAGSYLNVNSHDITEPYYWYEQNDAATRVGVSAREESNRQIFTITDNGEGKYYLRDADGYLIKCDDKSNNKGRNTWDVDAYSTTVGTPLWFDYVDGEQFYIRDYDKYLGNGSTDNYSTTNNYFKVQDGLVYCDAPIGLNKGENHRVVLWSVEEVPFSAAAAAYNSTIFDDETTTLSVTTVAGSGNYTYSWSPANGLSDATSANPTFTPATTGEHTFTCTVTDTESGSTAEASVTVYVNARPALQLTVSADKEFIYNDGETAVLTATVIEGTGYAPYTYSWTLNETEDGSEATYTFSNTTVGEYTLTCTVTDARNNTQTASAIIEVKDVSEKPLEIEIGSNEFGQNYIPLNSYYYAAFSQQIYTSDQIGQSGCIINDISFYRTENIGLNDRNIEIYLLNTDKSKFDNNNDWVKLSENDKVYANSSYTNEDLGWFTFTLDTPFEYTGGNLLVCMHVIRKGYNYSNYDKYAAFNTENSRALYRANDNDAYDISNITQTGTLLNQLNHIKFGYEIPAPKPESLVATPAQIHVGETTTLTWNELEDAVSYNIYVDGVLNGNTEKLTYGLSDLNYNVEPGHTIEVAAVYADATESGKASVTVQVAGTFTLTVNVTDGTNPIEGATVNIDMAYAYDEFKNQISPVTVEPTGADGKTTVELLRLPNEGFYDDNSNWVYPFYTVEVSNSPYQKQEKYINPGDVVTNGHTMDFVLELPKVSYIRVQDEEGEYLHGDVMEGTKVVLSWDAVEDADAYRVSKLVNDEVESSETITETTYTIEGVLKGYQYAVSALFGDLESEKTTATIDVKGNGYFKGYVTDGKNALQGIQVKVSSEYGASAVATTDAEGYFNGAIVEGDNYILTISHSDYEEFTSETFAIGYEAEYDFETITLTAKPSASDITGVTATLNGENVDVEWTVNETSTYTKYNVYRRLAGTQGKGDNIAQNVEVTSTTDTEWETLEPGTYQYGVAALVEPQAQTRGDEKLLLEEKFEIFNTDNIPEGWYKYGEGNSASATWKCTNQGLTSTITAFDGYMAQSKGSSQNNLRYYLVTPPIQTSDNPSTLTFNYVNPNWGSDYSVLEVYWSTINNGDWQLLETYQVSTAWQYPTIDLSAKIAGVQSETIYIAFCHVDHCGYGVGIDNVKIMGEGISLIETQIVWSDEVVKQGPATFIGGDTENPTAWNVDANWSTGSVPAGGAEVTINANAVISSAVNVSNLTINQGDSYPYNKLTVANGGALTVTGTITQTTSNLLVLEEGGQIFQNNEGVKAGFRMSIDTPSDWSTSNKDGWQFISMPMADVTYDWFTGADDEYDLYKYDGGQELEWLNHKAAGSFAETEFISGVGYLASLKDAETATVYGTLNTATSKVWGQYRINNDKVLANFRLLGNPFTFDMDMAKLNSYGMVTGYAVVNANGEYEYKTDGTVKVGNGFFVKLATDYAQLNYNHNTRSTRESNNSLNITATGNAGKDNVVINFAGKSEGFDKLQNFNDAIATVYVAEDGKNYGIYNCDADVQEVELSFNANKMGNYTISIEPNGKFQTVTLVDRFTGVETNMLVEDYNFTAMSSDNHNRFIVRFANGQQTTDNSHFVYQSGEELILNIQGEVQIVDVLGRVVYNGEAMNDINRINVSSFNSGAYMVKVMNGNEVKVEKIIL